MLKDFVEVNLGDGFARSRKVKPTKVIFPEGSFLGAVYFAVNNGNGWEQLKVGSRIDFDKSVLLDEMDSVRGGRRYLNRVYSKRVVNIVKQSLEESPITQNY